MLANSGRTEVLHSGYDAAIILTSIQIIFIVIAIGLTLGIVTCMVSHYKMGARSWSERRNRHPQPPPQGRHQAHVDLNAAATVAYMPGAGQERLVEAVRDRQTRLQSVQTDMALDLPPTISLPGEEEQYGSLQHLHLRDPEQESEIYRECIRPPPNRTVYNSGDSPPPYRSSSVGILNPRPHADPPPRMVRDWKGTPLVMRCHSMSTNNNGTCSGSAHPDHYPSLPTTTTTTAGTSPVTATNLRLGPHGTTYTAIPDCSDGEPPPGYSEVVANAHPYAGV